MKDPYDILGVPRTADDEQIKNAYRELARKYHPDNYTDNPLSDLASEKMKEINDAYDAIMNERRSGGKRRYAGTGGASSFPEVRSLIAQNRLDQAQELLDGVPPEQRNAEWYFLNGTVLYRRGWFDGAYTSFATASRMDPQNIEYRNAANNAAKSQNGQYNPYRTYDSGSCNACNMCQGLICADCCCEAMGGDLIPCC